jgi:hypothetical protein
MENFSTCERTNMRLPPPPPRIMFVFLFFIIVWYALDPYTFIRTPSEISIKKD